MLQKNNIFEHICYEISQYLFTFNFLRNPRNQSNQTAINQKLFNCIWDSHFIHMRNLKEFFSNIRKDDNIIIGTILMSNLCSQCSLNCNELIFIDSNGIQTSYSVIINKSVEHLTQKRITDTALSISQNTTIDNMFKQLFPCIKVFLSLLKDCTHVVPQYREDLKKYQNELDCLREDLLPYMSQTYNLQ